MIRIHGIELPQKLSTIHVLGDSSSNMMIAVEADSTVRDGFGGLTIWPRNDDTVRLESLLELTGEPRGKGKAAN